MNKQLILSFLLCLSFSIYSNYSWRDLFDDIEGMPQCKDPAEKKECQRIKNEIVEFKKSVQINKPKINDIDDAFPTRLPFIKNPYFKALMDQAFPNDLPSEKEERLTTLLIPDYNFGYNIRFLLLREFLKYRIKNDISLKDYIIEKLKTAK